MNSTQIIPKGDWARYKPDGEPMTATLGNASCSWHLFWEDGQATNLCRASDGNFSWPQQEVERLVCEMPKS
jgi:hypothetical protein